MRTQLVFSPRMIRLWSGALLVIVILLGRGILAEASGASVQSEMAFENLRQDHPQSSTYDSVEGLAVIAEPALKSSLSQYGITWTFDKEYLCGEFANGDYWVIGPVTIMSITPEYDGSIHGWEVNPIFEGPQGFDARAGDFDAVLVPKLPYTAMPNESIVKSISTDLGNQNCRPCLQTASVLTVLSEIPPENGAAVFRPPYVGDDKPFYYIADLRTDLLPAYESVPNTPSLEWVVERYRRVQLDHKGGRTGRCLHPVDHMPDYGGDIGMNNGDAALRLMLNDPLSEKMPALIAYVQYGIDLYHMVLLGQTWPDGGGHRPGQKLPLTFTAVLFDDQAMQAVIRDATFFHEDVGVYYSDITGVVLYGFHDRYWSERQYWSVIETGGGFKSHADPYGYIDGGPEPGGGYQFCCVSQPWKGSALALHLMPVMQSVWHNAAFFDYTDRWVNNGTWSQPDPCAPYDGNPGNYGVTYGPDGNGNCILDTDPSDGIGRFPDLHGTDVDGGYRYSHFQKELWNAYRGTAEGSTFGDVPADHWAKEYIEALYQQGYIVGCSLNPRLYCPDRISTRAEQAVFVMRGVHGAEFNPLDPADATFEDVGGADWYYDWSGQLYNDGYTSGCWADPLRYCPLTENTVAEGCVFFLRMKEGAGYRPGETIRGIFADVPSGEWYAPWTEACYDEGILLPCQAEPQLLACPEGALDRATAAYMMFMAKELASP